MKNISISFMRVCAMLLVVYYHCICFYTGNWKIHGALQRPDYNDIAFCLNCVHMPAFVYISGFLYAYLYLYKGKYRDGRTFLINKIRRLMVPYLLWGGIADRVSKYA